MKFSKRFKQCKNLKQKACCLYLGFTRFLISLSQVNQPHLRSQVIYNGEKMYVSQIIRHIDNTTTYRLVAKLIPETDDEVYKIVYVSKDEFERVLSIDDIKNDATWWWYWYRDSWLNIDCIAMANGEELCSVRILGKDAAHGKQGR